MSKLLVNGALALVLLSIVGLVIVMLMGAGHLIGLGLVQRARRKAEAGALDPRAALASMRSGLRLYYAAHEGTYPPRIEPLSEDGEIMKSVPELWSGENDGVNFPGRRQPHPATREARNASVLTPEDSGLWGYVNDPESPQFGALFIDCTHTDSRGRRISEY